jgi:endonuclease YncB( thermonuclease family)
MRFAIALLLALTTSANAANLVGDVVHVADGDTVTVLDAEHVQRVVRLAGIDAPERGQAFGQVSRRHLSDLVHRKRVSVEWHKVDRYGRLVGRVSVEGRDANLAQLEVGLAWHYKAYEREQSEDERRAYAQAEETARVEGLGLWQDRAPRPPWEFRKDIKAVIY